jgi:5-methyltetrahydropteroyltriglutamate--homocysteine methyltransferase
MGVQTTTIGSYPKPSYAPVANWFDLRRAAPEQWVPTRAYDRYLQNRPADAEQTLDRAVQEVVREQDAVGIDVPTDGEIRREHYIYYHCRHLAGFDFENLTPKSMRGGSWRTEVPTVTGPIRAGAPFLDRDWRVAQEATRRPVKITVPGPLTIIDSTADAFYGDERELATALADALNTEIRALAAAGCRWIQVDEPVFARAPEKALAYGIDMLARCFHGVPREVTRAVHLCCGYPSALDLPDYPKADQASYFRLAEALDSGCVDAVSIEDAHRHNDLALLERFRNTAVILGVVDIARSSVEPAEAIRERLCAALRHIDPARLMAGPDCGLTMLDRNTARAKLTNLVAAARTAR